MKIDTVKLDLEEVRIDEIKYGAAPATTMSRQRGVKGDFTCSLT
jgi:hypothetical protein